jgi:hypothetical protein
VEGHFSLIDPELMALDQGRTVIARRPVKFHPDIGPKSLPKEAAEEKAPPNIISG